MEGQVYKIHSDFYYVQKGEQSFECKIREVLKKQQLKIVTGDFVEFENGVISKVLPRKTFIPRPSVANVDQIVVVTALKQPDLDFHQLNRYISLAKYYKIPVILCFNK
jgi:ribosome biogenesis GTPase